MNKSIFDLGLANGAESRRARLAMMMRWGFIAAVVVIAPFAFALLAHVTALFLCGVLATFVVAFAPVIAFKLANWKMAATLHEVRTNPIPTLENALIQKKEALRQARDQLQTGMANVARFADQAREAGEKYPDMASRWNERAMKAQALSDARGRSFLHATAAVEAFEWEVERCRTEWQLVVATFSMEGLLKGPLNDPLATLVDRTAIEEVALSMNKAFAELEISVLEEEAAVSGRAKRAPQDATQSSGLSVHRGMDPAS